MRSHFIFEAAVKVSQICNLGPSWLQTNRAYFHIRRHTYQPEIIAQIPSEIDRRMTKDNKTKMATWNVRTLNRAGSKENIIQEMERLGIAILGLSEVRWTGSGKEQIGKDIMIYSGGEKHERGVAIIVSNILKNNIIGYWAISDRVILAKFDNKHFNISVIQVYAPTQDATEEEQEEFYDQLDKARRHCRSQEIIIVMGDLNAKIGKGKNKT